MRPADALCSLPLAESGTFDLVGPVLGVLLGVAVLIGLVAAVRKWMKAGDTDEAGTAGGFSLGGLRDLVRQGKMTQAEYDAAKAQIVAATHRKAAEAAAARQPDPGRQR